LRIAEGYVNLDNYKNWILAWLDETREGLKLAKTKGFDSTPLQRLHQTFGGNDDVGSKWWTHYRQAETTTWTVEARRTLANPNISAAEKGLLKAQIAAYASMLATTNFWKIEIDGFLHGDFTLKEPTRLTALHPYQPGRIPVVLVHGTASSPGRWADMVNELENDPRLHGRIQIWLFTYDTGNPVAYSARLLRQSLDQIVSRLEMNGPDPALHRMVLVGHSQGGLLIKMTAVDSGNTLWSAISAKPFDSAKLNKQTRDLLAQSYFVHPLPYIHRLVYIATPHQGSFVATRRLSNLAARFIKFPKEILQASGGALQGNIFDVIFTATHRLPTSVDDMTPGQPFNKALASLHVAPGVAQHSIIAVKDDGPPEKGNDGLVKYTSAHLADAASEVVVRSGHSCQSAPEVIDEVRRILVQEVEAK
jgi:triacylglycerol esterase/lipase EstA (alpha/beta hydrolase family)